MPKRKTVNLVDPSFWLAVCNAGAGLTEQAVKIRQQAGVPLTATTILLRDSGHSSA